MLYLYIMYSANAIKNFKPQNAALNAPRRIDVKLPIFQQTLNAFDGFPSANAVDGGLKYEESSLLPLRNANSQNPYDMMMPCIPQPNDNRMLRPEPIADSIGFQPPFGNARDQPAGIASLKKRDALFKRKVPLIMQTNKVIAPMMVMNKF